jgi:nucleoside triphosphate pyrophosphatase
MPMKLILASSSPRRAEILRDAGFVFEVRAPQIDEAQRPKELAGKMVARLAESKARAAAESAGEDPPAIIIGADTAVELEAKIFGKPRDAAEAREMLSYLSGRTHHVLTGIHVLRLPDGATRSAVETTAVTVVRLEQKEIDAYVASGEPFDKAGGYAIQGGAGRYIPRIEGCYFNVVGLPLARLCSLLGELGWRDARSA